MEAATLAMESSPPPRGASLWHNNKGQRGWNIMYGDGHVALFRFPKDYDPSDMNNKVNIEAAWW